MAKPIWTDKKTPESKDGKPPKDDSSGEGAQVRWNKMWIRVLVFGVLIGAALLFLFLPQLRAQWVPVANQILWVDVIAALGLTGIYPLSYFAYLGFGADAHRRRLRGDFQLFGLVPKNKLDETIVDLYSNVYSWPQFIIYIVLILSISLLIVLGYFERTRMIIISPGVMEVIFFGYLGAYVFSVQELVRRYNTFDLQPQVYSTILVRILITLALTFIIGALGIDHGVTLFGVPSGGEALPEYSAETWMLLIAFAIGVFPESGVRWLTAQSNRVLNQSQHQRDELPVRELLGISTWHEARLSMMGIDDAQNLATADLQRMLLTTQFDTQQVANWIDQAILYVKVGNKINRFREAQIATFTELLQTLSQAELQSIDISNQGDGEKKLDPGNLATVLGLTDRDELRRLRNYSNYPNFNHIIQYYRGIQRLGSQRAEESVKELTGSASDRSLLSLTEPAQVEDLRKELSNLIQTQSSFITSEDYTRRAVIYYQLGDLDNALDQFTRAIKEDSKYTDAYYGRGFVYLDQKNYTDSIWNMTKAIDLNPAFAEAYNQRGLVYLRMGYNDRAIADFKRALELDYRLAVAHYNLGVVYNVQGQFEHSLREFDRAYLLGYEQVGLWAIWGTAYMSVNRFQDAIEKLSEAIIRDPQLVEVYPTRANAYMQLGEEYYDQARADLEASLRRKPQQADAHYQFGNLAFRQKRFKEAIDRYSQALNCRPSFFAARYSLALSAFNLRELDTTFDQYQVLGYISQSQELNEDQISQLSHLAELLDLTDTTLKDLEESQELYRELKDLRGEALTWRQLGRFHYQRGNFEQARGCWGSARAAYNKLEEEEDSRAAAEMDANLDILNKRLAELQYLDQVDETLDLSPDAT